MCLITWRPLLVNSIHVMKQYPPCQQLHCIENGLYLSRSINYSPSLNWFSHLIPCELFPCGEAFSAVGVRYYNVVVITPVHWLITVLLSAPVRSVC